MIEEIGGFIGGALSEYYKDKKVSTLLIFSVTALILGAALLLYFIFSDYMYFKSHMIKALVVVSVFGVCAGLFMVVCLKLRFWFNQRKNKNT